MSDLVTLLIHPAGGVMPVPKFSSRQISAGPWAGIQMPGQEKAQGDFPNSAFNLNDTPLAQLLQPESIDVLIVWMVAEQLLPQATRDFGRKRVLIVADTQHLERSILVSLKHAIKEDYDCIFIQNRNHAHWFRAAGLKKIYWLPGIVVNPPARDFIRDRWPGITFIGNTKFHPRRRRIAAMLENSGLPFRALTCSQAESADHYANSLVSLNVSLNGDINFRIFEVLAAGGLLVTDRLSVQAGLDQFLQEGLHYIGYTDEAELLEKLRWILANREAAMEIARQGAEYYTSDLAVSKVLERFWKIVNLGQVDQRFDLNAEGRFGNAQSQQFSPLSARLGIYERLQELQRQNESVDVLVTGMPEIVSDADWADLYRIRFWYLQPINPAPSIALTSHEVKSWISTDEAANRVWDVVIGPSDGARAATHFKAGCWIIHGPNAQFDWMDMDANISKARLVADDLVELVSRS